MNEIKYQVRMTYEREDIAALVRTMEFRRHPEKNVRMARKIGFPIFGVAIMAVVVAYILIHYKNNDNPKN